MVLTNYECWASIGGHNKVCDITLEQAQLRSQIDLFNPRTLGACGVTHKVECSQQNRSCDTISKNVSRISSNGYYGFTYVNNCDASCNKDPAETGFGNQEADMSQHVLNNKLLINRNTRTELGKTPSLQPKKRSLADRQTTSVQQSELQTMAKRCRLDTDEEIRNSVDFSEQTRHMDVDEMDEKEAKSSYNVKSPEKNPNQNSTFANNFECDKNCIENSNVEEFKKSKLKKFGSNELFLEQMFSETHGSGAFFLSTQHEF